jgi:hypothetical protein
MKSHKTIVVNGHEITVTHEVKTEKNQTAIHFTASRDGVTLSHRLTLGAEDQPLATEYSIEQLQADVDKVRQKLAALVESKHRAIKLAAQIS